MSRLAARLTGLLWLAVLVYLSVPLAWDPFVDGAFAGAGTFAVLLAVVDSLFHTKNRSPQ